MCIRDRTYLGQFLAEILETWWVNSSVGNTPSAIKSLVPMATHSFPVSPIRFQAPVHSAQPLNYPTPLQNHWERIMSGAQENTLVELLYFLYLLLLSLWKGQKKCIVLALKRFFFRDPVKKSKIFGSTPMLRTASHCLVFTIDSCLQLAITGGV